MGFRSVIMKKKILLGIALCLGLSSAPFAQNQWGPGNNNNQNMDNPGNMTEGPTGPGAPAEQPGQEPEEQPGQESPSAAQPAEKTPTRASSVSIRFRTPWDNTTALMLLNSTLDSMKTFKKKNKNGSTEPDTCGWYHAEVKDLSENANVDVLFRQTIGDKIYGAEGLGSNLPISLDSALATGAKTIWIQPVPFPNGAPKVYTEFPNGAFGNCYKKIPVMAFDWLHGSKENGTVSTSTNRDSTVRTTYHNGAKDLDPDFGPLYATSNDFGSGGCERTGGMHGMVENFLGANGVPQPATPFPEDCKITEHLANWFIPQVAATDAAGNQYTNATCRDLTLTMTDDGFWLGQENKNSKSGGMFFLDDFQYLDDAKTVKNKYYDNLNGSGGNHNFGFTMKIQAKFEYVPGQYFEFYGDDDVWVFINNQLVVDIGGQHEQVRGSVDLDTLGLTAGKTYPFHIFYAERHTVESNFMMRTSIDLQTDASIFVTSSRSTKTVKNYDVWQIVKQDALSCDFDNSGKTTVDTTEGPSNFHLTGGKLGEEGVDLDPAGTFFEGIIVGNDYTTLSIDTAKIAEHYALAPGTYTVEISLKNSPTQKTTVRFTVPSYKMPSIVYTDSTWDEIGTTINSGTLNWSEWAYEPQKVYVKLKEDWATVNDYNRNLNLSSDDPNVRFLDHDGNPISKISLDDDGHAWFYVVGNGEVSDGTITVGGSANNPAQLTNVNFNEPPVPHVKTATIYDRNGDGRGDSLYIVFDKEFGSESILNSIQVNFGENLPEETFDNFKGKVLELTSGKCNDGEACGFGSMQFTGGVYETYVGKMAMNVTYVDGGKKKEFNIFDEPINDGIGPIIKSAVKKIEDGKHILTLTFSEAIADSTRKHYADMFQYSCVRGDSKKDPISPNSQSADAPNVMSLVFVGSTAESVIPSVGDQVRFESSNKKTARDLSKNRPHKNNPWVTITGDQDMGISSPGVITLDPESEIVKSKDATVATLVTDSKADAKSLAKQYGVQGQLIDFDIVTLTENQTKQDIAALDQFVAAIMNGSSSKLDTTVTKMSTEDATKALFKDIAAGAIGEGYGLSENLVNAIAEGKVTAKNYTRVSIITDDEIESIQAMVQSLVESSEQQVVSSTNSKYPDMESVFEGIANGKFTSDELESYGISPRVVKAIKNGKLTTSNIDSYRDGEKTLVKPSEVKLTYRTYYYSHLGDYVNGESGSISCSDPVYQKNSKDDNCITNGGKIFLAWNMKSKNGKLVGTGVYVARLEFKVTLDGETVKESTRDFLWGVRRGKMNGITLDPTDNGSSTKKKKKTSK